MSRTCFFGGPGAGKTTNALTLAGALKRAGHNAEYVDEYVKPRTYDGRQVQKWNQTLFFGKQQDKEFRYLPHGVHTVTDSPVLLSSIYARAYYPDSSMGPALEAMGLEYERDFPAINIYLRRGNKSYQAEGRWQSREEAGCRRCRPQHAAAPEDPFRRIKTTTTRRCSPNAWWTRRIAVILINEPGACRQDRFQLRAGVHRLRYGPRRAAGHREDHQGPAWGGGAESGAGDGRCAFPQARRSSGCHGPHLEGLCKEGRQCREPGEFSSQ